MFNKDHQGEKRFTVVKVLVKALVYVSVFCIGAGLLSSLVMFLWNAILPEVTGVKPLTFWQAAGLLLLSKILIGGMRGFKSKKDGKSKKSWMNMSTEEREEMKERWRARCQKNKNTP